MRLWCVRAERAPVVGVFARCFGEKRWMCALRWDWSSGKVDEGAWTTMEILVRRCALSPDGKFLLFAARGSTQGPFNAMLGGAYAVSRLPWLTALTDPRTIGPGGEYESHDALRRSSQKRLWEVFEGWLSLGFVKWPYDLGFGWTHVGTDDPVVTRLAMRHGPRLAARTPLDASGLSLLAVVDSRINKHAEPEWNIWNGDLRYYILSENRGATRVAELPDARWAAPARDGRVLVATADASLQVLRLSRKDALAEAPQIEHTANLSGLTPRPGPAPAWARAELKG